MALTEQICAQARTLGFDEVGVAPAMPSPGLEAYRAWLAQGFHGEMVYLARADRVARRADPALILPQVRSVICVAVSYYTGELPSRLRDDQTRGRISRYAWVADYHEALLARLEQLGGFLESVTGTGTAWRAYVDTGPLLERAYAARAGLGFIGKNTCLIHPRRGSYLFLGELLTDLELAPTAAAQAAGCGTCRRCLDGCPTRALVAPYVLDARRCTSYLTIALKGPIPRELRPHLGQRIFGCDICQEVCPFQRFAQRSAQPILSLVNGGPEVAAPLLLELMTLDEEGFHRRFTGTTILRVGRRGLLRNVAVALGNRGDPQAVPALTAALGDAAPLVRAHAAWALGCIGTPAARGALSAALAREGDTAVREEIGAALA